jgi:hypothetical protein
LLAEGRAARERVLQDDGRAAGFRIPRYFGHVGFLCHGESRKTVELRDSLSQAMIDLVCDIGERLSEEYLGGLEPRFLGYDRRLRWLVPEEGQERQKGTSGSRYYGIVKLKYTTAGRLLKVERLLARVAVAYYRNGLDRGTGLLQGLADGSLTAAQFTAQLARDKAD